MAAKKGSKKGTKQTPSTAPTKEDQIRVRVTTEQKSRLVAAARKRGLPLSNWLVSLGLREADNDDRDAAGK